MKPEFENAMKKGDTLFEQTFCTMQGVYDLKMVRYMGEVFYFKYKNSKLVECNNLNKMKGARK